MFLFDAQPGRRRARRPARCRLGWAAALIANTALAVPVTLTWEPPAGYEPAGYVVGYGEASGSYATVVDVGNARVYLVGDLPGGRTYYFSVRAYDAHGGSSAWAKEIAVPVLNDPPPPTVSVAPVVGLWANVDEPGSGYALDFKHGVLVVTVYSYTAGGDAQWYIASGPIVGTTFTSPLDRFVGGQCISCAFAGGPVSAGSAGTITIVFTSPTSATVYLPQGRVTRIQPLPF